MKKKKVVAVAAAAIMAASTIGALAGCGKDPETTITVFLLANSTETTFYRNYFKQMEEDLKEEFAEEGLEYKIDFSAEQESNYYQTLKADIQNGSTPDIFYLRPNELLQYGNMIADLDDYAKTMGDGSANAIADLSTIYDTALNMYRYNPTTGKIGDPSDHLYAFPKDLSTQQLGYSKTLLKKFEKKINDAGYKLPYQDGYTGYTWEEFKQVCKVIADNAASNEYACDIPSVEILAKSFSDDKSTTTSPLMDLTGGRASGTVGEIKAGSPLYKAIQYQAEFVACGAGNYRGATYQNFTSGRVCFYGACGSWEVGDYNDFFNKDGGDNWGVMAWPTENKGDTWQGLIKSAGYVVSKSCAEMTKGDVAKRIALSFLSRTTQNQLMQQQISLPLIKDWAEDYTNPENDAKYSPSTRGIYLDVISGEHGFFPASYSTYDDAWIKPMTDQLEVIWLGGNEATSKFTSVNWTEIRSSMQGQYNATKNN